MFLIYNFFDLLLDFCTMQNDNAKKVVVQVLVLGTWVEVQVVMQKTTWVEVEVVMPKNYLSKNDKPKLQFIIKCGILTLCDSVQHSNTVFFGRQSRHLNFRLLPARNVNSNMLDKYGHGFSSFTAILPNT